MKKIHFITLFFLSFLVISCSDNEANDETLLKADYKIDLGFFKDLTINMDNNIYALSIIPTVDDESLELLKIASDGKVDKLYTANNTDPQPGITNDATGKLYWTTDNLVGKIYSFSDNYTPFTFYTMQGADQMNVRINGICNLNDDQMVIYDTNLRKFKLYSKSLNNDFVIAGSENYAVEDGIGTNASFVWVSRINTLNNNIYALDSQHYIRKIDGTGNFNVSTICHLNHDLILDFAIDSDDGIYAIVRDKGFCKLSNGFATVLRNGVEKIKTANNHKSATIDWSKIWKIYIKNGDLYLVSDYGILTKISDFKEKLQVN